MQSLYREYQFHKEDLLDGIRELSQELLLKDTIIAAFVPQVRNRHALHTHHTHFALCRSVG